MRSLIHVSSREAQAGSVIERRVDADVEPALTKRSARRAGMCTA